MLEITDTSQNIGLQIKQIAEQYYFAACTSTHAVCGYICNLKSKLKNKKCDFKVSISKEFIKKNQLIITSNIVNDTQILVLKGNPMVLDTHQFTYLDENAKSPGTDLVISPKEKGNSTAIDKNGDTKMMGLEFDQIQQSTTQHGILKGVELASLESKVETLLSDGKASKASIKALKTGSLVAVLEQSLHANDIETINWVLSNTDTHVITQTVKKVGKETLQQLLQNILIKLQQGVQKSSLLWLSIVLKLRWLEVIKYMNTRSTMHSQQSISTIHTYLSRKTKNLSKYYEVRAKLQMVVESGEAILESQDDSDEEMKEIDPAHNSKFPRMSHQVEDASDQEEDISDVDEVVEDQGFDQVEGEGFADDDGDEEDDLREDLEQYADDVFEDEGDEEDALMDESDDEEDLE